MQIGGDVTKYYVCDKCNCPCDSSNNVAVQVLRAKQKELRDELRGLEQEIVIIDEALGEDAKNSIEKTKKVCNESVWFYQN